MDGQEKMKRAEYCRQQAARAREKAAEISSANRKVLLEVAASWEKIARSFEREHEIVFLRALSRRADPRGPAENPN